MVWSAGTVSTGARFTSLTTTLKLFVALRLGLPLSLTRTVTRFVLEPWSSTGVQLIAPLLPSMLMPAGAVNRAKVSVLAGISASVAVALTLKVVCSATVWSPGTVSTGARFTSFTITLKLFVALRLGLPLSLTRTVTRFVLGPWLSPGVQVIAPLLLSMLMPAGAVRRAKVSVLAGMSASAAAALTLRSEEHTSELQSHSFISYAVF